MYQGSEQHKNNYKAALRLSAEARKLKADQRILTYTTNPTKCKQCQTSLSYDKRFNKFCSSSCSASYNNTGRTRTTESKQKVSEALTGRISNKFYPKRFVLCKYCLQQAVVKTPRTTFCSVSCRSNWTKTEAGRQHQSNIVNKCIEDGNHKGWAARHKLQPSYPEQYFIDLFHTENIEVQREIKFGKYFADFFIESIKLVIEIDGKQHSYPDHIARDHQKDEYLSSIGLRVLRITWYNPRTNRGKELLYPQIQNMKQIISIR